MKSIYRPEAVAHASRRLTGEVVLQSTISLRWANILAVAFLTIFFVFLSAASFGRKETVSGWLTPPGGLIRVQAPEGGVVEKIHVTEGQVTKARAPLVTIRLAGDTAAGNVGDRLSVEVETAAAQAEQQAQINIARLREEEQQTDTRHAALADEIRELDTRIANQAGQVEIASGELARAEQLSDQGFISKRDLEARRTALLSARDQASSLQTRDR